MIEHHRVLDQHIPQGTPLADRLPLARDMTNRCATCSEPASIVVNGEFLCGACFCLHAKKQTAIMTRGATMTLQDVASAAALVANLARFIHDAANSMRNPTGHEQTDKDVTLV